ncbi:MAG: hypothetical protein Q9170_003393 [Blastenia crenularia]
MADPLSFVASVVAVASLAGIVVTKGYCYIKAVKDCPDDVRSLMAEINVLSAILQRLVVLLRGSESKVSSSKKDRGKSLELEEDKEEDVESEESMDDVEKVTDNTKDGLVAIYAALQQVKLSNKYLADLRAKQDIMVDLCMSQEQEKDLAWLSTVSPALKLNDFQRERQPGTGTWLFDLPEFSNWLETSNNALWIYGIPGAGKTILSTLVVDEVLRHIRSELVGTAYFYIRHDDKESHKTCNVLGSLLAQLARQNYSALAEIMELRDEHDIRKKLSATDFQTVSIAATSADIRLFASAWLPSLEVRGEKLRAEIVDTLVEEAHGILPLFYLSVHRFMWVRAQMDYLQRLPSDSEKRKALSKLLPDLPQTYIRIFETIDGIYPEETKRLIRRVLEWQVLRKDKYWFAKTLRAPLTGSALCQAICIENEHEWPSSEAIPSIAQVLRWLGCLARKSKAGGDGLHYGGDEVLLSHFSIREFLTMPSIKVASPLARNYLVDADNQSYMTDFCLTYLMHSHFQDTVLRTWEECQNFDMEEPLYGWVATTVGDHLLMSSAYDDDMDGNPLLGRFLSMPRCRSFRLWDTYISWYQLSERGCTPRRFQLPQGIRSPLKFACYYGLASQVQNLLAQGASQEDSRTSLWRTMPPLHLGILSGHSERVLEIFPEPAIPELAHYGWEIKFLPQEPLYAERSLRITQLLVGYGVDINQQQTFEYRQRSFKDYRLYKESPDKIRLTPITIALQRCKWKVASFLLSEGAIWDAITDSNPGGLIDVCSVKNLSIKLGREITWLQRAIGAIQDSNLKDLLEKLRDEIDQDLLYTSPPSTDINPERLFVGAYRNWHWKKLKQLLLNHPNLDVDSTNEDGHGVIHWVSLAGDDILHFVLKHGADPNLADSQNMSALGFASQHGCVDNMRLLLEFGADLEHQNSSGLTPLLVAVTSAQCSAVDLLLDAGASCDAVNDDGMNALHLAVVAKSTVICATLLKRGLDPSITDNYGTTPLNEASFRGFEFAVGAILEASTNSKDSADSASIELGTPLYIAARKGHENIVNLLLDAGAEIDEVVSGNLLGSALLAACGNGHTNVVTLLLTRGAALEVDGARFLSAAGTARAFRQEAVLKVLEKHGRKSEFHEGNGLTDESSQK